MGSVDLETQKQSAEHTTAYVGLSGGVDSAVSAAILKDEGYNVIGAFIKIWRPEFIDCPWQKERLDAMRVCATLEIPFKEIDLSDEYKKNVIDEMVRDYTRGITPNPDILCNRHIKFGAFAEWAFSDGADFIATGHYAQNRNGRLVRGKDINKDQSYFLVQVTPAQLQRTRFPVGGFTKVDVRARAQKYALPVAAKADSQGLCFVGDISMRDFLAQYLPLVKGPIVNERGERIGEHDGAALYTLGERHGLHIFATTAHEEPWYVAAIDTDTNTLTVSHTRTKAARESVRLENTNWHQTVEPNGRYTAQARYREEPIACTIEGDTVHFEKPHLAPPGQTLVVYEGDVVVGAGTIAT